MDFKAFMDWLKQPSTLKALVMAAGMAGWTITPEYQERILFIGGIIYAGLGAFYDQQPRTPTAPPPCDPVALEATLTTAQIAEVVRLRKAKMAAAKA
jgi:hypothetical protein